MGALTSILAVAGALAGTAMQARASQEAKREGRAAAKEQEKQAAEMERQTRERVAGEDARKIQEEARRRQRALALGAQGGRSTILTSPLGAVGSAASNGTQKTLLGM